MKKRYKCVNSAEAVDPAELINDRIKGIEDDFDYIVDGVDKLSRHGQSTADTLAIIDKLESNLSEITAEIAKYIVEAL